MFAPFFIMVIAMLAATVFVFWSHNKRAERKVFIRTYLFPKGLYDKLLAKHPNLSVKEQQLVGQALRQYFLAYSNTRRGQISMPSQVVDDLWHEFILYTRDYQAFCGKAFGKFMHHTPAVIMSSVKRSNAGLRLCWWHCCKEENINPKTPQRLPLLFAIDAKLKIANGFVYVPDCSGVKRQDQGSSNGAVYCGGDFSSLSFDGSTDGWGDSSGDGGGDGCGGGGD